MFYTLQELMAQIKGWEYLIAVAFLGMFLAFLYLLVRGGRTGLQVRQSPVAALPVGGVQVAGATQGRGQTLDRATAEGPKPLDEAGDYDGYTLGVLPCWVGRPLVTGRQLGICATCPVYTQGMERLTENLRRKQSRVVSSGLAVGSREVAQSASREGRQDGVI